ncbi:phage holin family protein [Serratia marcescens]|uniref:phage holin family protein n=2 Tax=Serratia TaxID=613 RepID=UPI003450475F
MTEISEFVLMVKGLPWNALLLGVNAVACAISAGMLGTYQRNGAKHRVIGGVIALVLIVACGSVTILIATGRYVHANPAETVINVMLCISLIYSHGNVMKIFRREDKK